MSKKEAWLWLTLIIVTLFIAAILLQPGSPPVPPTPTAAIETPELLPPPIVIPMEED